MVKQQGSKLHILILFLLVVQFLLWKMGIFLFSFLFDASVLFYYLGLFIILLFSLFSFPFLTRTKIFSLRCLFVAAEAGDHFLYQFHSIGEEEESMTQVADDGTPLFRPRQLKNLSAVDRLDRFLFLFSLFFSLFTHQPSLIPEFQLNSLFPVLHQFWNREWWTLQLKKEEDNKSMLFVALMLKVRFG